MVDNSWQLGTSQSKSRSKSRNQMPPILKEPILDVQTLKNSTLSSGMPDNKSTAKTLRPSPTPISSVPQEIDHRVITDKVYSLVKQAFRASYSEAYPSQTQKSLISEALEINEYNPNISRHYQRHSSHLLPINSDLIKDAQSSSFSRARFPSIHNSSLNNSSL
jgi:hypothetical protein